MAVTQLNSNQIKNLSLIDDDISLTAGILGSKISPTFTAQVVGLAGTALAPSYSFTGSLTTGVYSSGTNLLAISAQNNKVFEAAQASLTALVPLIGSVGTVSSPSLTFTGDTGTGIYHSAAGTVSITSAGTEVLSASSAAITHKATVKNPDGLESTPSITFTSNVNAGIYYSGVNQISVSTNSIKRFTVGLTEISAYNPVLAPVGTVSDVSFGFNGDPNTGLFSPTNDTLGLVTAGTERLRVDSSGRVGIGTGATALTKSLTVAGAVSINTNAGMFLGRFTNAQETTLVSGLVAADGGVVWFNTDDAQFKGWKGTATVVLG